MRLLTVTEAARKSGLSPALIKHACADGEIDGAYKIGKAWVFTPDAFDNWNTNRRPPGNPNFKPRP